MGVFSAIAFFLKFCSAVVEENIFEVKQLVWLKVETTNEGWVIFWRVFAGKIWRDFALR